MFDWFVHLKQVDKTVERGPHSTRVRAGCDVRFEINVHSACLIGAFMLVVPGVLVTGPIVLLTVAPHANLHLLFLVPAIAHIYLIPAPCVHGLRRCGYKVKQRKTLNRNMLRVCKLHTHNVAWESNSITAGLDAPVKSITFGTWRLFTHRTYAVRPSHTQSHGSLGLALPSWSWYPLVFPRRMCHCPPSLVEQCQGLPMKKTPSFGSKSHPNLQEKRR